MPAPECFTATPPDPHCCLLVTGASGNLGQLVLHHLLDTLRVPACRLVAGSRTPETLTAFAKRGVLTRWLDFRDPASVFAAAQGVDRVLLISTPDGPERTTLHEAAVRTLAAAGVKHLLYTSFLNADRALASGVLDHRETEELIRATTLRRTNRLEGFTFLRNSLYFDNYAVWIAGNSHRSGEWFTAAQHGRLAGIARSDAALAAATALASSKYENQVYELSSTQGLTIDEIAATISKAIGKPIHAVHVSEQDVVDSLVMCSDIQSAMARRFASMDTHIAAGLAQPQGDDFQRLTGQQPVTHAHWVDANRAALLRLVW